MQDSRKVSAYAFAILMVASATALADGPFAGVNTAANRSQYNGNGCPITIVFTATINLHPHGPLVFNYRWERSDGAKGPVQVMRPGPNQRSMVVRDSWRLGKRGQTYDASETIHVNSGNTHEQFNTPTVHVICR